MQIAFILGSIRPDRQSEKPARYFAQKFVAKGIDVLFIDLARLRLPIYDGSRENAALPSVLQFLNTLRQVEGVVMIFPEYNNAPSGVLLNAVNYLEEQELLHKPLGLVSVTNNSTGGVRALFQLQGGASSYGATVLPTSVSIPNIRTVFPTARECLDSRIEDQMDDLLDAMQAYVPALNSVRQQLTPPLSAVEIR